jgi:hypothetical protein
MVAVSKGNNRGREKGVTMETWGPWFVTGRIGFYIRDLTASVQPREYN